MNPVQTELETDLETLIEAVEGALQLLSEGHNVDAALLLQRLHTLLVSEGHASLVRMAHYQKQFLAETGYLSH